MRVMRKAAVGLLLIFVNLNLGLAWDEPKGFRDVPWGAAASDVQSGIKGVKCPGKGEGRTLELCFGEIWIGPVRAIASAWIGAKGFEGIDMSFPSSAFPQMEVEADRRRLAAGSRHHLPVEPHRVVVAVGVMRRLEDEASRLHPLLVRARHTGLESRMAVDLE
jgi:hypothetical protein